MGGGGSPRCRRPDPRIRRSSGRASSNWLGPVVPRKSSAASPYSGSVAKRWTRARSIARSSLGRHRSSRYASHAPSGVWESPRSGRTASGADPPNRIRPPTSQITADLPRQRARKPKAPIPYRAHPQCRRPPPFVFHADSTASASLRELSRTAQHRNLIRRAAGRGPLGRCRATPRRAVASEPRRFATAFV